VGWRGGGGLRENVFVDWRFYSLQDVIELVRNKTGLNHTSVESVWSVYDTLFCEVSAHTHTHTHTHTHSLLYTM